MARDPRTYIPKSKGPRLGRYRVSSTIAPLHRRNSRRSGLDTQLLFGQNFDVYEINKNWAWGQACSPIAGSRQKGYVGFVSLKDLNAETIRANCVVSAIRAPVFSSANIKSPIRNFLPLGALIKITNIAKDGDFGELITGGFVHHNHHKKRREPSSSSDYVDIAERHLGLPYIWGGISTMGLDCSGLVQSSLRAIGTDAPRDSDQQEKFLGSKLPFKQSGLKRGDLVFWKGHVGIMISSRQMIHANAFHMSVEAEPLKMAVRRILENGGGPITAIKRL